MTEGPIGSETRTDDPGSDKGVLSHMDTILHYDDNDDGGDDGDNDDGDEVDDNDDGDDDDDNDDGNYGSRQRGHLPDRNQTLL